MRRRERFLFSIGIVFLVIWLVIKRVAMWIGSIISGILLIALYVPFRLGHGAKRRAWSFLGWDELQQGGRKGRP